MNSEGIGLGLLISKGLIESNGGQLRVYSEGPNNGTQFMFNMDMTKVQDLILPNAEQAESEISDFSPQIEKV